MSHLPKIALGYEDEKKLVTIVSDIVKRYDLTPSDPGSLKTPKVDTTVIDLHNHSSNRVLIVNRSFGKCGGLPLIITEVDIKTTLPDDNKVYTTSFIISNSVLNQVYATHLPWECAFRTLDSVAYN